jgi:hypothetical protein
VCALLLVTVACASTSSGAQAPAAAPTTATGVSETVTTVPASTVVPTSSGPSSPTKTTTITTTITTAVDPEVLADISRTSVPSDVIVPTDAASLDEVTNPINGRRGGRRSSIEALDCATAASEACLVRTLDTLGFDVTSGPSDDRDRRVRRATAVVQLDAGLPMTGVADDALLEYLGPSTDPLRDSRADETRQIGTSADGQPLLAMRYGNGSTTVLVVGQTHGDEEGGLRVLLRARSLPLPEALTLWVVPTMNPDGLVRDTRFLANAADPNRRAPSYREQQAVYDFALAVRPSLSVWYHQNYGWVGGSGSSVVPARQYQTRTELGTLKRSGDCAKGFMWCPIDDALGSNSILVELPDVLTPADVQIHAAALLEVAAGDFS